MTNRSLILDTTVRLVFDAVLVFSVYLLFSGHNQPGGGFVGGLVAAGAVALRYLAGGLDEVRRIFRIRPWSFLSIGLALAVRDNEISDFPICNKSFDLSYRIHRIGGDAPGICAEGRSVMVCFDYTVQRTIAIPEDWRGGLSKLMTNKG